MTVILNSTKYSNIYQSLNEKFYGSRHSVVSLRAFFDGDTRIFEQWVSDTYDLKVVFGNISGYPIGARKQPYLIEFDSEEEKTLFLLSWNA